MIPHTLCVYEPDPENGRSCYVIAPMGWDVAPHTIAPFAIAYTREHAELIAAAPAMLRAIRELLHEAGKPPHMYDETAWASAKRTCQSIIDEIEALTLDNR